MFWKKLNFSFHSSIEEECLVSTCSNTLQDKNMAFAEAIQKYTACLTTVNSYLDAIVSQSKYICRYYMYVYWSLLSFYLCIYLYIIIPSIIAKQISMCVCVYVCIYVYKICVYVWLIVFCLYFLITIVLQSLLNCIGYLDFKQINYHYINRLVAQWSSDLKSEGQVFDSCYFLCSDFHVRYYVDVCRRIRLTPSGYILLIYVLN